MREFDSPYVVSITPFDAQGRLDEEGLRSHLTRLADAGVGVYLAGGGSGEGFALTLAETRRIFEIGAETIKGRVPVRAMGHEPHTALELHDVLLAAQEAGLDAAQVYSLDGGHVFRPGTAELEAYYADVLDGITIPLVLSTHPAVGYFLPMSLVEGMCAERDVVGINVTNPDVTYLVDLLEMLEGHGWLGTRISVHVGGEMQGLTNLALGGQGIISSMGNLVPRLLARMHSRYRADDVGGAAEDFALLLRIYNEFTKLGGSKALKVALGMLGLAGGYPRRPRLPIPEADHPKISALLDRFGIAELELADTFQPSTASAQSSPR
jgi:4-hydroxy-tetrahydrodipicolinate synthase